MLMVHRACQAVLKVLYANYLDTAILKLNHTMFSSTAIRITN